MGKCPVCEKRLPWGTLLLIGVARSIECPACRRRSRIKRRVLVPLALCYVLTATLVVAPLFRKSILAAVPALMALFAFVYLVSIWALEPVPPVPGNDP